MIKPTEEKDQFVPHVAVPPNVDDNGGQLFLGQAAEWVLWRSVPKSADEWDDAIDEVVSALAKGKLSAMGVPEGDYDSTIAQRYWQLPFRHLRQIDIFPTPGGFESGALTVYKPDAEQDEANAISGGYFFGGRRPVDRKWTSITMDTSSVLELWPVQVSEPDQGNSGDASGMQRQPQPDERNVSEKDLRTYLEGRKAKVIDAGTTPPAMTALWADAKIHFKPRKVGRDSVASIWRDIRLPEWTDKGPRGPRSSRNNISTG